MNNKNICSHFSKEDYLMKVQTFNQVALHVSIASKDVGSMNFDKKIENHKYTLWFLGYLMSTILYYITLHSLNVDNNEMTSLGSVAFYLLLIYNKPFERFLISVKKKYCKIVLGFNYQH